jgi:hypothetical protein
MKEREKEVRKRKDSNGKKIHISISLLKANNFTLLNCMFFHYKKKLVERGREKKKSNGIKEPLYL